MDALVMCGGRGTRLGADREKPLVRVAGEPMVDRVLDALAASRVDRAVAAVSPHTPETRTRLGARTDDRTVGDAGNGAGRDAGDGAAEAADDSRGAVAVVETPGEGYVADLRDALGDDRLSRPVLTVAADLPLLDGTAVDRVLDAHDGGSLTVAVPAAHKRELGVSVDTTFEREGRELAPAGVNVVGDGPGSTTVFEDGAFTINVNRPEDIAVAERLLAGE